MQATITAPIPLVSETPRHVGDTGDARRSAHNPEVGGSNSPPATRQNGPPGAPGRAVFMRRVVRTLVRGLSAERIMVREPDLVLTNGSVIHRLHDGFVPLLRTGQAQLGHPRGCQGTGPGWGDDQG
jgi:hypothetical protein